MAELPTSAVNPLDIRTILTQVHVALVDVIDLAYAKRYPEAADLQALAAYDVAPLPDRALVYVASEGVVYRLLQASVLPGVLPHVVVPNSPLPLGNGRWVREATTVTLGPAYIRPLHKVRRGYLQTVQMYQGQDEEQLERIFAQRPAVLVEFLQDSVELSSYMHGGIYEYDLKYTIHALSSNLRDDPSALIGSAVPGEVDPGLYQLIGDLRYLLAGCRLGLAPGVKFSDVQGSARIIETDLAQRSFTAEIDLTVKASVHIVDEDLEPDPEIWIERRDAGTPNGEYFDPSNQILQGLKVAPTSGLTATPTAGLARVLGVLVAATPGSHTFPSDSDTYRDLALDGSLTYRSVDVGDMPPYQAPKTLRVGMTRTGATSIDRDVYLCSYAVPSGANPGDPFEA